MNYSIIAYIIGWILNFEALFMALPCITAIFYHEHSGWAFFCDLRAAAACSCIGFTYIGKSNVGEAHAGKPYVGKSNAIK